MCDNSRITIRPSTTDQCRIQSLIDHVTKWILRNWGRNPKVAKMFKLVNFPVDCVRLRIIVGHRNRSGLKDFSRIPQLASRASCTTLQLGGATKRHCCTPDSELNICFTCCPSRSRQLLTSKCAQCWTSCVTTTISVYHTYDSCTGCLSFQCHASSGEKLSKLSL